jgi:hypothetical protein
MWLKILLVFLALVVVLLCSPLVIALEYNQTPSVGLKFFGFSLWRWPNQKKKAQKTAGKKKASAKKSKEAKTGGWNNLVATKGVLGAVKEMISAFSLLSDAVLRATKGAKVRNLDLQVGITGQDAADAAITYGQVCSVLYPFLGRLSAHVKLVRPHVNVYCDYENTTSLIRAKANVHIPLYRLVATGAHVLKNMIKKNLKNKGGNVSYE